VIGINRSEHGRSAGIRTTLLVCLSASMAMILANLMIDTAGKAANSFVQLDMMRLPLGIPSGIGFIGAGTIVRRNDIITGVTTAATMWFVTMLGLCFGAGHEALGLAGLAIAAAVLWVLKWCEKAISREHSATLTAWVQDDASGGPEDELRARLISDGYVIVASTMTYEDAGHRRCVKLLLRRLARDAEDAERPPALLRAFAERADVKRIQ
jgi:putative Mg2+ transporter-C (MgtC) family protein